MRESQAVAGVADRTLDILEAVRDLGATSLPAVAARCGLPLPTVHRLARSLIDRGYLIAYRRGRYGLGPACLRLTQRLSLADMLREAATGELKRLAQRCAAHAHLGVFEGDMVTYLAKVRHGCAELPTAEGTQLEAYCSGIGKVLLGELEPADLDRYLSNGPFIPLTERTETDPARLRARVVEVRARGWATDMGEVIPDLFCIAVPVRDATGRGVAALSVSYRVGSMSADELSCALPALNEAASSIALRVFATDRCNGPAPFGATVSPRAGD